MTIRELVTTAFADATARGWHDVPRTPGEDLALIHSEISEALEEIRMGAPLNEVRSSYYEWGEKPEGFPIELADAIIRIADMCGLHEIDLEAAIEMKLAANRNRPYRHGDKVL